MVFHPHTNCYRTGNERLQTKESVGAIVGDRSRAELGFINGQISAANYDFPSGNSQYELAETTRRTIFRKARLLHEIGPGLVLFPTHLGSRSSDSARSNTNIRRNG